MRTFNHVGIVTTEQKENAFFNEGLSVWLTDYSKSPNRIEFLKIRRRQLYARTRTETRTYCLYSSFT